MDQTTNLVADTICRTVELGVTITGAAVAEHLTHIDCRPVEHGPDLPNVRPARSAPRPRHPHSHRGRRTTG